MDDDNAACGTQWSMIRKHRFVTRTSRERVFSGGALAKGERRGSGEEGDEGVDTRSGGGAIAGLQP